MQIIAERNYQQAVKIPFRLSYEQQQNNWNKVITAVKVALLSSPTWTEG